MSFFSSFPRGVIGLSVICDYGLGPRINGLVTNGNTKLCYRASILALFHSTTVNKIDSEHIRDYKQLLPVYEVEMIQVTAKKNEVFSSLRLLSDDFLLKVPKIVKNGTLVS